MNIISLSLYIYIYICIYIYIYSRPRIFVRGVGGVELLGARRGLALASPSERLGTSPPERALAPTHPDGFLAEKLPSRARTLRKQTKLTTMTHKQISYKQNNHFNNLHFRISLNTKQKDEKAEKDLRPLCQK